LDSSVLEDELASLLSRRAFPASLIKIVKSSTATFVAKSSDRKIAIKEAKLTDRRGTDMPAEHCRSWQLNPKPINLKQYVCQNVHQKKRIRKSK
jgi:hypothetical protein